MAAPERSIINRILLGLPETVRLFRINAGQGWQGSSVRRTRTGAFVVSDPRPFHGAPEGWPDLCGWTTVTVTEDMVGKPVAVFTAVEVKTARVRLTPRQRAFLALVRRMGGRAEVVRSTKKAAPS